MTPDATLDDTDTEFIGSYKRMITHLDEDAITSVRTFSIKEAIEEEHVAEIGR